MKFQFRLNHVLKHRRTLEDEALREYRLAQREAQKILNEIEQMYASIDNSQKQIETLQRVDAAAIPKVQSHNDFLQGLRKKIEMKKVDLREKQQIAEDKQEVLREAARNVKILEKLEEKQAQEFYKSLKVKEDKEMNDMIVMRHQRGDVL